MPNHGSESQFEATTIDRLHLLGYRYQHGATIERDQREVVMVDWLRAFLRAEYADLPADALEEAIVRFTRPPGVTTEARNLAFHRLLTGGLEQRYRRADGTEAFAHLHAVDWANPDANDFCVVNQLAVRGQNDRRPDILVYVNGLPLVLFELKNPYEEEPNTLGAFNQVQHYRAGIAQLFDYNALVVVSDGGLAGQDDDDTPHLAGSTLHGMWTATWEWYAPWKSINGLDVVENATGAMKTLIEGLFPKERLLDYLRHFIAFEVVNEQIEKKGAKYHQFFGVRFAVQEALRATRPDGDRKIGVVWHTQGSGKSLSMAYFVAILRHHPQMENPSFVIQVDRTDLDDQLHDQFVAVRSLVGNVQHAGSVEELRSLLRGQGGEIIFSTIEKFRRDDDEAVHPVLSERRNLIVIADEAHRTQYGLTEGFAHQLRRALPHASFIGFTGTPVAFAAADTASVFGQVIHTYDMVQSKRDHSTVPIYYDPQLIRLELTNERIDEDLAEITESDTEGNTGGIIPQAQRARWAAIAAAAGTKERMATLAAKLLTHFQTRNAATDGKALAVCMSRQNCVRLHDALRVLPGCPEVKIVMTGNLSEDPPAWSQAGHITTKPQRDAIKERMRDIDDPLKIVIVRDMWLTGTDIPCLHTLYVDKPMKGHTLMQAIARVNRIFRDKPGGLVVDFIGIGDELKAAARRYTQGGNTDPSPDINEEAKAAFLQTLDEVRDLLPALPAEQGYGDWRGWTNIGFEDCFVKCCGHLVATDERRDGFLALEGKLNQAFSLVNHLPDCLVCADEVVFYQLLRKQLRKTTSKPDVVDGGTSRAVRELLDRSIESKGVVDLFQASGLDKPDISILDEGFLGEFAASPEQENLRLKLLTKLLADELGRRREKNAPKYKSFREMLEATLQKYHNRAIQAADVVRVLIQIKKEMDEDEARAKQLGLSSEEVTFYNVIAEQGAALYDQAFLCGLVKKVVATVKRNLKVDWTQPHREDVKAGVRAAVKTTLRREGVTSVDLVETMTRQIIFQAAELFRDWPLAA